MPFLKFICPNRSAKKCHAHGLRIGVVVGWLISWIWNHYYILWLKLIYGSPNAVVLSQSQVCKSSCSTNSYVVQCVLSCHLKFLSQHLLSLFWFFLFEGNFLGYLGNTKSLWNIVWTDNLIPNLINQYWTESLSLSSQKKKKKNTYF